MQVHGPSRTLRDDKEVGCYLNNGFVNMKIGDVNLYIRTPEECDWLIKAAVKAKRLLTPEPELPKCYVGSCNDSPMHPPCDRPELCDCGCHAETWRALDAAAARPQRVAS